MTQAIEITDRRMLRRAILHRYGTLTQAAVKMKIGYDALSSTLGGRKQLLYVIDELQSEFELTDEQVLDFWPLVKRWPRPEREAV